MSIEDRDYMNRLMPRAAYRGPARGSVTMWLIGINVAVYFLDLFLARSGWVYELPRAGLNLVLPPLQAWGHFSRALAIDQLQLWRFVTFQFLHANFDHLVFNMLSLYFFGPLIESYLHPRQFLIFFLLCGSGGAAMYLVLMEIGLRIGTPWVPLVGASAGIFGVLIAAAIIAPHAMVYLFGIIPMRLATLAHVFIAYAVLTVLLRAANAGGEAAHLGGALLGWLLMKRPEALERLAWLGKRAPPF